jgi:hypothetical protein
VAYAAASFAKKDLNFEDYASHSRQLPVLLSVQHSAGELSGIVKRLVLFSDNPPAKWQVGFLRFAAKVPGNARFRRIRRSAQARHWRNHQRNHNAAM